MHIVDTINHKRHKTHGDFLQYSKKQIFLVILVLFVVQFTTVLIFPIFGNKKGDSFEPPYLLFSVTLFVFLSASARTRIVSPYFRFC